MAFTEEEKRERKREAQKRYDLKTGYAAQKKYQQKIENKKAIKEKVTDYCRTHTKMLNIRFMLGDESGSGMNDRDTAIWEHLNKQKNKSGYIKDLIEADMKKNA